MLYNNCYYTCQKEFCQAKKSVLQRSFKYFLRKLYARVCGEAAVNGQYYTRDKACRFIVDKEQKSAFELFAFAKSAHGRRCQNFARSCRGRAVVVPQKLCVLLRGEEAGRNSVDADTYLGEVHRKPLRKVGNCRLCAAVCRNFRQGRVRVHRRNIQNIASLSAYHLTGKCLRGNQRA